MKFTFEELLKRVYCGAKTRAGTPCKRKDIYYNGRCKLHGGLSTGPTTEAGKKKVSLNGRKSKAHEKGEITARVSPTQTP